MKIAAANAELHFFPNFIKQSQSYRLFDYLLAEVAWQQDYLTIFDKTVKVPRLQAWYGDIDAVYGYSGLTLETKPWLPVLDKLRKSLSEQCSEVLQQECSFNSVLINLYRDQQDSVAWHSDDEPELGQSPVIASVSLGATRNFKLKHKTSGEKLDIALTSGSLLLMAGQTQHYWQHAILKSQKTIGQRINLTFRHIVSDKL